MTFQRGDVVYGADPFKGADYARPWLIVNDDTHPFQGEQYIVLALTTGTWHDGFIEIPDTAWVEGGTPKPSRIIPWSVETLEHDDVGHWQGTIAAGVVDEAVSRLTKYVSSGDP